MQYPIGQENGELSTNFWQSQRRSQIVGPDTSTNWARRRRSGRTTGWTVPSKMIAGQADPGPPGRAPVLSPGRFSDVAARRRTAA